MKDYLTPADAAELLGVSVKTIMRHLRSGALPGTKLGRLWIIRRQDLDARLAASPPAPKKPRRR